MLASAHLINCRGSLLDMRSPVVMGILNLTPDSFSDGGRHNHPDAAVEHVGVMLATGAGIIDIGAVSSRPGAQPISAQQEIDRMAEPLSRIREAFPAAILSIDTSSAAVAQVMLGLGAHIINDISAGLHDVALPALAAQHQAPYVCMHMQGTPQTMQDQPHYTDVVAEVHHHLVQRINALRGAGVADIILDPGFGFGKTLQHNYQLFAALPQFTQLGLPLLVGISRKSMLSKVLDRPHTQLMPATCAMHWQALQAGARILRVHDVAEAAQVVQLFTFMQQTNDQH